MSRCRLCGASIQFHRTANGKSLPLDFGANLDGNVTIIDGLAIVLGADDPRRTNGEHVLLMPHFATCPVFKKAKT